MFFIVGFAAVLIVLFPNLLLYFIRCYCRMVLLVSHQVPELAGLGRVFRSAAPVELTESETEYVVRCVKHIMDGHVVLDFTISNTIEEQVNPFEGNV